MTCRWSIAILLRGRRRTPSLGTLVKKRELSIEVPPETTGRALDIQVRPTSLRVYHKVQRVLVFEGELWGRVRSADLVDFVWELEASGSDSGTRTFH